MLWSELKGRKVVSTASAEKVGKLKEVVVDGLQHRVVAFVLGRTDEGSILLWSALKGVGSDAVTVPGADALVQSDEQVDALRTKAQAVLGKRVLSVRGDDLGTVKDLDLDPAGGEVTALVLERRTVPGRDVRGVGSYAVVVAAQP